MIQSILAYFGYIKIPKSAVSAMRDIEEGYRRLVERFPNNDNLGLLYSYARSIRRLLQIGQYYNSKP